MQRTCKPCLEIRAAQLDIGMRGVCGSNCESAKNFYAALQQTVGVVNVLWKQTEYKWLADWTGDALPGSLLQTHTLAKKHLRCSAPGSTVFLNY